MLPRKGWEAGKCTEDISDMVKGLGSWEKIEKGQEATVRQKQRSAMALNFAVLLKTHGQFSRVPCDAASEIPLSLFVM